MPLLCELLWLPQVPRGHITHQNYLGPATISMQSSRTWSPRQQKYAKYKALEQKLIGPMEESLTKEQLPQNSWENGALSKEIENPSKKSKNTGLSCRMNFFGGRRRRWELE